MTTLTPPPVPKGLREMLKDYPEHIQRLQSALDEYVQKPFRLMPLDGVIWALEGRLETFVAEARQELRAAEASGNVEAIKQAKSKKFTFGAARADMGLLTDLQAYFSAWSRQ
jgi:hypothetical protein